MLNLTSTLWLRRAISWPLGIRSFSITVGGRCHTALKLSSWMADFSIGVGRSGLPTTPAWRDTIWSLSTASICAAGMLTTTYRLAAALECSVRRARLVFSCLSRDAAGMFSAAIVRLSTMPVGARPLEA